MCTNIEKEEEHNSVLLWEYNMYRLNDICENTGCNIPGEVDEFLSTDEADRLISPENYEKMRIFDTFLYTNQLLSKSFNITAELTELYKELVRAKAIKLKNYMIDVGDEIPESLQDEISQMVAAKEVEK